MRSFHFGELPQESRLGHADLWTPRKSSRDSCFRSKFALSSPEWLLLPCCTPLPTAPLVPRTAEDKLHRLNWNPGRAKVMPFLSFKFIFVVQYKALWNNCLRRRKSLKCEVELSNALIFSRGDNAAEHLTQLPSLTHLNLPSLRSHSAHPPSILIPPNLLLLLNSPSY